VINTPPAVNEEEDMAADTATSRRRKSTKKAAQPQSHDELAEAVGHVEETAARLFDVDRRVHAVGVSLNGEGKPFYRAVRNVKKIVPQTAAQPMTAKAAAAAAKQPPFPVVFVDAENDAAPLLRLPFGPATAAAGSMPEQATRRPLRCGQQIQNFDDDSRQGVFGQGFIIVGTIGCFVKKNGADSFILSNNHVVAGENRGKTNDRILQSGSNAFDNNAMVARLASFVSIKFSPDTASVAAGTVVFNDVDAGIARLEAGIASKNRYLPGRTGFKAPKGVGQANVHDAVSKVGRTTGATRGTVTSISTIVGPVEYDRKPAWFRNSIEIEGISGTQFSDHGDSGSAIVNANGEVVALLYAGNGTQTYACPIDKVISALGIAI
jgi:hypothetical protein